MEFQGAIGIPVFLGIAWLFSENSRRVPWRLVAGGVILQVLLCLLLLKLPPARGFFLLLNRMVLAVEASSQAGTSFVFGYLGGGTLPFEETVPGSSFILAFRALPLILLMSALSALLFYWRVLPWVVRGFSWFFRKTLGLGGAEGLGVTVNIFVGMVEAPLFIRPFLKDMTRSEIFALMASGMATIAGTVMVLYAGILRPVIPDAMGHILVASVISVPAAVTLAKVLVPDTGAPTSGRLLAPEPAASAMDAVTRGTLQGVHLLINILAMLVVLVALVHLVNLALGLLPALAGAPLTLQRILGAALSPLAWVMGIPWREALDAGALLGTKTVLNELIAYLEMVRLGEGVLSERSRLILTYALCGFANPGSLGIMIGGMGTMAPERREEIVSLGLKSVLAGTLATCMTGSVVGLVGP